MREVKVKGTLFMTKKEHVCLMISSSLVGGGTVLATLKSLSHQCIFRLWWGWINIGVFVTAESLPVCPPFMSL